MWWFHIKGWQHRPEAPAARPSGATEGLDSCVALSRFGTTKHGEAVWRVESQKPFGEVRVDDDPDNDGQAVTFNLRFPGQYSDAGTGLYYNYFRDYDPSLGRYIQADPRGILLDFSDPQRRVAMMMGVAIPFYKQLGYLNHNYNYVDANPITGSDPTGENTLVGTGWGVAVGGPPGAVVGGIIGTGIAVGAYLMCTSDDEPEPDKKNCEALKQSILNTCYGLTGRKRMACFEAANTAYRQCMGYE